ncbi:MAG TPA: hypothetical protein VGA69_13105 [Nitriliruptorales bacterium]
MRYPTWNDIRRFCEVDGWEATHEQRQRKRRDHDRFRKHLPDGTVLRTKASHGKDEIGDADLVNHIIRRQLQVTHEEFWDAVDDGTPPARSRSQQVPVEDAAPAHDLEDWLAVNLAVNVGLSDEEIASISAEDAMDRYLQWCQQQAAGPS